VTDEFGGRRSDLASGRLAAARLPVDATKIRNEIVASRSGVSGVLGVIL